MRLTISTENATKKIEKIYYSDYLLNKSGKMSIFQPSPYPFHQFMVN